MRIIGIDPGLTRVGIGIIDVTHTQAMHVIDWCTIETNPHGELHDRIDEIGRDLDEILSKTKPDLAVVEKVFFSANKKSAMDTAEARGAIVLTLTKAKIHILTATPLQMKMAITGDGRADKKQVQWMVKTLLKLSVLPSPADAADALGLALYGAQAKKTMDYR